ncbi:hypothetical protein M8J77_000276 [Diaphorina citri]|nr:hypothetical protein M8J77_000276 [Diaphorina citri]
MSRASSSRSLYSPPLRKDSTSSFLPPPVTHKTCMSAAVKRYRYLRRLFKFEQMDFEFALWQMTYLFISPQKVYKNFNYRKEAKSQFARDDPAFLVLLAGWLCLSSLAFTLNFHLGFWSFVKFLLNFLFMDCIAVGLVIATFLWYLSNKYLIKNQHLGQDVEWAYCFDVHLNAFCPMLVISHIVQLLMYNIFMEHDWFLPVFLGNLLWFLSLSYYVYITFLGYNCLPILHTTQVILSPLIPILIYFAISMLAGWNMSKTLLDYYHYRAF